MTHFSNKQKLSLALFIFLLVTLPLAYAAAKLQIRLFPRAYLLPSAPVITTDFLPTGQPRVAYKATVNGFDLSAGSLTMTATGLPSGLTWGPCSIMIGGGTPPVTITNTIPPSPTSITRTPTPPTPTPTPIPNYTISKTPTPTKAVLGTSTAIAQVTSITPKPSFTYTLSPTPTSISRTPTPPTPTANSANQIFCLITGTPLNPGIFPIGVTLRNNQTGQFSQKTLKLVIGSGTISITPSPTPITNAPPSITTTNLPVGRLKVAYQALISGVDKNPNDRLTIVGRDLPPGLVLGNCLQANNSLTASVSCTLSGYPTKLGYFGSSFVITDSRGGSTARKLPIIITPNLGIKPPPATITIQPRY